MCDRYFVQLPIKRVSEETRKISESLKILRAADVTLHSTLFTKPLHYNHDEGENGGQGLQWKNLSPRRWARCDKDFFLKRNVYFLAKNVTNVGFLLTQLTWAGLLKFIDKRIIMMQSDDTLRAISMLATVLKKEELLYCKFLSVLKMTGNSEIAKLLEANARDDTFKENHPKGRFGKATQKCASRRSASMDSIDETFTSDAPTSPMKKRKTSADSGLGDECENSVQVQIEPAPKDKTVDIDLISEQSDREHRLVRAASFGKIILIQNGHEDDSNHVVLCKCGHYHQFPKWKQMIVNKDSSIGFTQRVQLRSPKAIPRAILNPVTPVEIGHDFVEVNDLEKSTQFTKPRKLCEFHKLRFHRSCKPEASSDLENSDSSANSSQSSSTDEEISSDDSKSTSVNNSSIKGRKNRFHQIFKAFL